MKKRFLAMLLTMVMVAAMAAGCGNKDIPSDTTAPAVEESASEDSADNETSDIYTQGSTELPRKDVEGDPNFIITVDDDGNQVIVPYSGAGEDAGADEGEVLDGTAEDHMMVDDDGKTAE